MVAKLNLTMKAKPESHFDKNVVTSKGSYISTRSLKDSTRDLDIDFQAIGVNCKRLSNVVILLCSTISE